MLFWSSLPPIFFSRARDRNFSLPLSSHAAPHPRLITRAKEEKTRAGRRVVPTVLLEQVAARHIFPPSNHLVAKNARIEPEQLTTRTSCFGFVVQIIQIIIEQIIIQQTKHASRFRYGPRSCRCGAVVGSRAPFFAAFCRYMMPKNIPARTTPKNVEERLRSGDDYGRFQRRCRRAWRPYYCASQTPTGDARRRHAASSSPLMMNY